MAKGASAHRLLHISRGYPKRASDIKDPDGTLNGVFNFLTDEDFNLADGYSGQPQ